MSHIDIRFQYFSNDSKTRASEKYVLSNVEYGLDLTFGTSIAFTINMQYTCDLFAIKCIRICYRYEYSSFQIQIHLHIYRNLLQLGVLCFNGEECQNGVCVPMATPGTIL